MFCIQTTSIAQNTTHKFGHSQLDSIRISNYKLINNIYKKAINAVSKSSPSLLGTENFGKSEQQYIAYDGKIIRYILIEGLDFERTFKDTSKRSKTLITKVANKLHTNTKAFVVRNNLFIKENSPVDAYKIADNERYLRSLEYIHDARILIEPIDGVADSVDLLVVTKDFFPISIDGASNGANHIYLNLVNVNLAGMGQRLEMGGLYDYNRNPNFGFGGLYRKDNVAHSFVNATIGYGQIYNSSYTHEEETSYYISLDRALVSPYSHIAGGLILSHNEAVNRYSTAVDSLFYKYRFNLQDGWVGYNLGIKRIEQSEMTHRTRAFLSLRYFKYHFLDVPVQVGKNYDPIYNNKEALLAQFTLFKQEYFKTQYIYGFGTTEDLPYGYNIALIGGWYRQLQLQRPYAGLNVSKYLTTNKGDFIELFLRTGGYYSNSTIQDGAILFGSNFFSRLVYWNSVKVRQFMTASYSQIFDRVTSTPLRIDNGYGIRGFISDSVYGNKRLSIQSETEFYLKYKFLGFQFAPFVYADLSWITPPENDMSSFRLYSSLGGGIRARNENLIFETIELRFYFYPKQIDDTRGFKVVLNSNIRFRYNSNYVTAPNTVQLNNEY